MYLILSKFKNSIYKLQIVRYTFIISLYCISLIFLISSNSFAICQPLFQNDSIQESSNNNYMIYTNTTLGVEMRYPQSWYKDSSEVFDLSNVILQSPSYGQLWGEEYDERIKYPISSSNIFETISFLVGVMGDYPVGYNFNNKTSKYVTFYSPIENSSDFFRENLRIFPKVLSTNIDLDDLLYYIKYYSDSGCYYDYPSRMENNDYYRWDEYILREETSNNTTLINSYTKLKDYTWAFIDLYSNCIPSFNLINYELIKIGDNIGINTTYSFELDSKLEVKKYQRMDIFMIKENALYIISYNALSSSFSTHLPIVKIMIESIKL